MNLFISVLVVALSVVSLHAECCCDPRWTRYEGKCYRLFVNPKLSWPDAQEYCEELNANLATINNAEENSFLQYLWVSLQDPVYEEVYIGYNDLRTEGTWRWVDGSDAPYTNWDSPPEPNNGAGTGEQDCAGMYNTGEWDDYWCERILPFVCEKSV